MFHRVLGVTVVQLLAPCLARAQSVQEAMEKFNLPGTWATDCAKPADASNFYAYYAVSAADQGTLTYDGGEGYKKNSYVIHDAKLLGSVKIELEEETLSDHSFLDLILAKSHGQIRVVSSRRSDGTILIEDGKFQPEGAPTQWYSRCDR
jgi:hypothetical protein